MGEREPLIEGHRRTDIYDETERKLSVRAKVALSAVGIVLGGFILYVFIFLLPDMFIPQKTALVDIPHITALDVELTPIRGPNVAMGDFEILGHADETSRKKVARLILVGDVHGHFDSFKKLLKQAKYNPKRDHLLVLGDFITKGPDSLKMLNYLVDNKIDCILGNHEYIVLQSYARFHELKSPDFGYTTDGFRVRRESDFSLAKKLQPEQVQYINRCSVIKTLGEMPIGEGKENELSTFDSGEGIAVHAGLRWDLELAEQDPYDNLEMRAYIGPFFNRTTSDPTTPNAVSWSKIFNKKQEKKHSKDQLVVYYGHDARSGLNLRKFSKGLDSGCGSGRKLTAMVIWNELDTKGRKVFHESPLQVKC
jgi:bis(5'-nucleosyl)-tetraphosphatase (symmetrical)